MQRYAPCVTLLGMNTTKKYASNAERQAAHRARHRHKKPLTRDEIYQRVQLLRTTVIEAAERGDEVAQRVAGGSIDEMLLSLIEEFADGVSEERLILLRQDVEKRKAWRERGKLTRVFADV